MIIIIGPLKRPVHMRPGARSLRKLEGGGGRCFLGGHVYICIRMYTCVYIYIYGIMYTYTHI